MRRALPTTNQYLLDNVAKARLNEAYATGDAKRIAQAEKYYKDLSEDECELTTPYEHPEKRDKWVTTLTCRPRGFTISRMTFGTGSVYKMIDPAMSLMLTPHSLELATVTNLYYIRDVDRWHLLVHKDANIHEALKMTGWEFKPEEYKVVMFPERNTDFIADGYVEVTGPVVAGRIFITTVYKELYPEAGQPKAAAESIVQPETLKMDKAPVVNEELVGQPGPTSVVGTLEETAGAPVEGVKLETEVVQSGDTLAEAAADKSVAILEAAKDVVPVAEPTAEESAQEEASVTTAQPVSFGKKRK